MSGYVDQHLQVGEVVEYRGRPSKSAALLSPTIFLILFVILDSIDRNLSSKTAASASVKSGFEVLLGIALLLFMILVVIGFIAGFIFINSAEYAVTDRRVVAKYGLLRRKSADVLLTNLSGVKVNQDVFGHVLGYGDLLILVSGGNRLIAGIKQPQDFRSALLVQLDKAKLLRGTAAYSLKTNSGPPEVEKTLGPPSDRAQIVETVTKSSTKPTSGKPLPPGTSAQWAVDPFDENSLRYWDGDRWTEHVSPAP